ncbi:MAG: Ig-like domain-containing protein, partial [Gemmatimonadota bacterium]|nr:Ig-like domain-containing protein [Gemmatimonadota bacterium]
SVMASQWYPAWGAEGIAFQSQMFLPYNLYLRQNQGRTVRISRNTTADVRPSFARIGLTYVNSVVVTPGTAILSLSTTPTQAFATTITDNFSVPIVPASGITWTTSDALVATVDATGLVTAVGTGTVTVTASAGGWRVGTATVTVNP